MTGLALAALLLAMSTPSIPNLENLKWHSRIVLLFAPREDDSRLDDQRRQFQAEDKALTDRDLEVFAVTGNSHDASVLRGKFHVRADEFAFVLIGKDGGEKLRKHHSVEPSEIFQLIDKMPMRRDEMSRQR